MERSNTPLLRDPDEMVDAPDDMSRLLDEDRERLLPLLLPGCKVVERIVAPSFDFVRERDLLREREDLLFRDFERLERRVLEGSICSSNPLPAFLRFRFFLVRSLKKKPR
mmetsp:Transcript_9364/g.15681  ORF Transcript_9364/g.15681 Transcript_9364/m.15681 type:complete len:110 (+) Transcript_9364:816-1145(+)